MAEAGERDSATDELYGLPLDEFTNARDELARRLRREGDRDGAEEVKRLRKPSVAAWALNQARRESPELADELIDAGERLREGQERLLAGEGREALEQAAADERRLVEELAGRAERELAEAGRPPAGAVQEKLRSTLHAAASDPQAREALAAGRLLRDHEASGLGMLGAATPAPAPERKPTARQSAARDRRARRLEERLERARAKQRKLEEASAEAEGRVREAERAASRAAKELEAARAAVEKARGRAEQAAGGAAELERELNGLR